MSHDRKFIDTFMVILGALILFSVALIVLSKVIGGRQQQFIAEDPAVIGELEERIRPIGQVAVEGLAEPVAQDTTPGQPPPVEATTTVVMTPEPAGVAGEAASGKEVYENACMVCHAMGLAGAPRFGDAEVWAARAAKGPDLLYSNAINGYQGEVGYMPAKGGQADLSDDDVRAAVDYMLSESQ